MGNQYASCRIVPAEPAGLTIIRVTVGRQVSRVRDCTCKCSLLDLGRIHARVQADQHCVAWTQNICKSPQEIRRFGAEEVSCANLSRCSREARPASRHD